MSKQSRIYLINEKYSDNLGDNAISACLSALVSRLVLNEVIEIDFSLRTETKVLNHNSIIRKKLKIKILQRAYFLAKNFRKVLAIKARENDIGIIGGGQLIQDNTTFPISTFLFCMYFWLVGAKIIFFGVGCGRRFGWFSFALYWISLRCACRILVRDSTSKAILSEKFGIEAHLVPDVVYSFKVRRKNSDNNRSLIAPINYEVFHRYSDESPYQFTNKQDYIAFWIKTVKEMYNSKQELKLFATTKRDLEFCHEIYENLPTNIRKTCEVLNFETWVDVCGYATENDIVIAGRMHALILFQLCGATILPFNVSSKIVTYEQEYMSKDVDELREELCAIANDILSSQPFIITAKR